MELSMNVTAYRNWRSDRLHITFCHKNFFSFFTKPFDLIFIKVFALHQLFNKVFQLITFSHFLFSSFFLFKSNINMGIIYIFLIGIAFYKVVFTYSHNH